MPTRRMCRKSLKGCGEPRRVTRGRLRLFRKAVGQGSVESNSVRRVACLRGGGFLFLDVPTRDQSAIEHRVGRVAIRVMVVHW